MSNRPRLSSEACEVAEVANDRAAATLRYWQHAWADRRIDEEEARHLTHLIGGTESATADTVTTTATVDEAIATVVVELRCGLDSPRARRMRAERESRLRLIRGGKDDQPDPAGPVIRKRAA